MTYKDFQEMSEEDFNKMKSEWGRKLQSMRRVKRGGWNNPEVQKKALETRRKNKEKRDRENLPGVPSSDKTLDKGQNKK